MGDFKDQLDKEFLDGIVTRLAADPLIAGEVLKRVGDAQKDFMRVCETRRNCEADQAILDLIGAVVDPKGFARMKPEQRKTLMHRVIAYQFPNGLTGNEAPCEKQFYEMFAVAGEQTKRAKKGK